MSKCYISEVFGTFLLILIGNFGLTADCLGNITTSDRPLTSGLSFGFAIVVLTIVLGPVSGAHLNPAITLGSWFSGAMRARRMAGYLVAQLSGGAFAAAALWAIALGCTGRSGNGAILFTFSNRELVQDYATEAFVLMEFLATFILVTVALGVSNSGQTTIMAGLMIGLTLAALHVAFAPIAGNALNPARSIGQGLISGGVTGLELWSYILAPLGGGALAGLTARAGLFARDDPLDTPDP
ncbi:MIP/aquaporin family protein [Nitratireductor soli]|uniref:MIP/aquaporin family protein n=1 Tax=Nitratireductor soli TaxID=1670619 RepID=UPI00065DE571|nr:aquaporin [Nitratireductor soli]